MTRDVWEYEERRSCPTCGEPAGEPCRTGRGAITAQFPHMTRYPDGRTPSGLKMSRAAYRRGLT